MNLSRFFVDRPIFAGVISIVITLLGAIAFIGLPIAQYPEVVPPTVVVSAFYPGADARTLAETVATPLEQEINGVEDMLYLTSSSTSDGRVQITVTFRLGTDLDKAQVLVQNKVNAAFARLPEEVRRQGVTAQKRSPGVHPILVAAVLVAAVANAGGSRAADLPPTVGSIERLDGRIDTLLPAGADIAVPAMGFTWTEGPVWIPAGP